MRTSLAAQTRRLRLREAIRPLASGRAEMTAFWQPVSMGSAGRAETTARVIDLAAFRASRLTAR